MVTIRWRKTTTYPLVTSFVGLMDLKLGVSIITLFALLNKVAGVYGMMAIVLGAPGTFAQISLYLYSIATIGVFIWGLKAIGKEDPTTTLTYSHFFLLDHLISTIYTSLFAVVWYIYVPHDGRRVANSDAQKEMMGLGLGEATRGMDEISRKLAAERVWMDERGFAAAVLVGGWLIKVYFIFCLYSFALHLRRGSYHSLPLSRPRSSSSAYKSSSRQPSTHTSPRYAYSNLRTPVLDSGNSLPMKMNGVAAGGGGGDYSLSALENGIGNGSANGKEQGLGIISLSPSLSGGGAGGNGERLPPTSSNSNGQGTTTGMLAPQRSSIMSRNESTTSLNAFGSNTNANGNNTGNGNTSPPPLSNSFMNGHGTNGINGASPKGPYVKILGRLGGEDS